MQLSRVVIAVVFFIIGALIAIPALIRTDSPSQASGTPTPAGASTPSQAPTATPTRTTTRTPTRAPTPAPSATASPTRSAPSSVRPSSVRPSSAPPSSVRPSTTPSVPPGGTQTARTTPAPVPTPTPSIRTPRPTASRTTTAPITPPTSAGRPLGARIGAVRCPGRTVTVTVTNSGGQTEDYAVEQDGSAIVVGRIAPGTTRTARITLREDRATTLAVTWRNEPVRSAERKADCRRHTPAPKNLPHTGADDTVLYARIATGIAAMVTGAIVFWYGGIWPRRRDRMLPGDKRP